MIAALGIAPWIYVPYCFLNLINPVISAIYGYTGFTIKYLNGENEKKFHFKKALLTMLNIFHK